MESVILEKVFPFMVTIGLAVSIPSLFMVLSSWLGPRKPSEAKGVPYECGIPDRSTLGDARARVQVKFYLLAMCFLIFDVEVAFLFPWALWFQDQAAGGLAVMGAFLGVLILGWFYLLKRGALNWD